MLPEESSHNDATHFEHCLFNEPPARYSKCVDFSTVATHPTIPQRSFLMSDYKRFEVTHDEGVTILRLVDAELSDLVLQDAVHEELMTVVEQDKPSKLLLDFSAVQYCTTGIIGSLLTTKSSWWAAAASSRSAD